MEWIPLLGAAFALLATVGLGLVAHELSHAVVLHFFGVPYDIRWFPGRNAASHFAAGVVGTWATVTPRVSRGVSVWGLRLSAVAPLVLALPFALVLAGAVPDPLNSGNGLVAAVTVAWLACALPSPQDFSVFWYAGRAVDEYAGRSSE